MRRNNQLDFFRGFFLLNITAAHFMAPRNILIKFTNEGFGWVSAAEGFVFLSGLTAGLVYTYKYIEKGDDVIKAAARNRAWLIYKFHMALFLFIFITLYMNDFIAQFWVTEFHQLLNKPIISTLLGALLVYQPNFLDILPMYAVFVLFIPLIIRSLERGYHKQVLLISGTLYLAGTFQVVSLLPAGLVPDVINMGDFDLLSWQFLFVIGLYLGSSYYHGTTETLQRNKTLFYVALLIAVPIYIIKFFYIPLGGFDITYWADKTYLRPIRFINFAALLVIITHVATRFTTWFHYKPICTLGKFSLEVFAFHIVLLILFKPLESYLNTISVIDISNHFSVYPLGTLLIIAVLFSLFLVPRLMTRQKASAGVLKKVS